MPAKSVVWALFETRPDPHNLHKPLKYKSDKTHSAAWCNWKGKHNIYGTAGVIPIAGKVDTMLAHARQCTYTNKEKCTWVEHQLAVAAEAKARAKSKPVIIPSYTPSTTNSASHLVPDPDTHHHDSDTPCSEHSGCRCKCHTPWDENHQKLFEADLCDLFVACNFSFNAAENPQTRIFFNKWVPGAEVPDCRKLSGSCLDAAVTTALAGTQTAVFGQYATGQSDGWKNVAKTSVLTSTMNVNSRAHLVCTHDMTGRPKTGQEHLEVIKSDMAHMETTYGVTTVGWVTDDGPDGKGTRTLLRKLMPWLILLVCWAHQCNLLVGDYLVLDPYRKIMSRAIEVAKWFNNHSAALDLLNSKQLTTYEDHTRPLTLLLLVITRWTAHLHAAVQILDVKRALVFVVAKHKQWLIAIAASSRSSESQSLADHPKFWAMLQRVHMLSKLEARWKKNADQDLFILAGLLNPYVLSRQDLIDLAVRPTFRTAVEKYLEWEDDYTEEKMKFSTHLKDAGDKELVDRSNDNMKAICTDEHGLPHLVFHVLSVARIFSDFGVTHTCRRNRLSPETVHKVSVVRKALQHNHAMSGLLTTRLKRKLAPGSYELSQAPTPVSSHTTTGETREAHESGSESDGPLEFESAIDSRAHMEAQESDSDEEEEVGEKAGNGSSAQRAVPQTGRAPSQPESSRKKKQGKTAIRLADLFLYPRAPPGYDSLSNAEKQIFDASDNGDRLRCLRFIWRMGELQYLNEQRLTETLQHEGRTEA
ncbi:hypothetical protein V8D89_002919 [Ganoderma adspersum]